MLRGSRQIFVLGIDLAQPSCGTGVPMMTFQHSRRDTVLLPFYDRMGPKDLRVYWSRNNSQSIGAKPTGIVG